MNYVEEIHKELKEIDKKFVSDNSYGKIVLEISYQKGKYVCDTINNVVKKRYL